jgi:hypothetical protein
MGALTRFVNHAPSGLASHAANPKGLGLELGGEESTLRRNFELPGGSAAALIGFQEASLHSDPSAAALREGWESRTRLPDHNVVATMDVICDSCCSSATMWFFGLSLMIVFCILFLLLSRLL